ncbi:hypothetical protein SSX86_012260 [Deinandra increscens subsp. villosa]|uniref:Uncharacterized protein n=1 Tax=Deinandra increscens subsp. villosa TaxID=3103831 RepID=A0AAP0D4B0_9ASTR
MDIRSSEMPSKIRKRRFPTASSSSFANNNLAQFLVEMDLPRNDKCVDKLDRSFFGERESDTMALPKSGSDNRVNDDVIRKSSSNVDRVRSKSRSSHGLVNVTQVSLSLTCNAKSFEGKSRPYGEIGTVTKDRGHLMPKLTHGLDEIKHSLTISKEILKLLANVWTADPDHDHRHPTSISLASTLSHELNKARSHVNKLIQEHRSSATMSHESEEQDKIRFAVKTISRELETERKLRRQAERMNKKLGRELATTKSCLAKAVKKAESEKQATEILDQLCQEMACSIEEHRVELEELKKESERVQEEMEEEREMLRVADMLREERIQMKLIDAKYEYEDKHKKENILAHDLDELLEADDGIFHITPKVLSWYQSTDYNDEQKNTKCIGNDKNTLGEEARGLSWFANKGEIVNDKVTDIQNEVVGRNSDCIEWEFGLDMKKESNGWEERDLGLWGSSTMKEYEDEMERYKMIKDLRDRIVSGSLLS